MRRTKPNVQFDTEIESYTKDGLVLEQYKKKHKKTKHKTYVKLICYYYYKIIIIMIQMIEDLHF